MSIDPATVAVAINILPSLITAIKEILSARSGKKIDANDAQTLKDKISEIETNLRIIKDGTKNIAFRQSEYSGLFFSAARLQTLSRSLADDLKSHNYDTSPDTRDKREYVSRQFLDMVKDPFNTELNTFTGKMTNMDPLDQGQIRAGIGIVGQTIQEIDAYCSLQTNIPYQQIISKLEEVGKRAEPIMSISKTKMDLFSKELHELGAKLK